MLQLQPVYKSTRRKHLSRTRESRSSGNPIMQTAVTIFTWPGSICTLVLLERQVDYLVIACCILPLTLALLGPRIISVRQDYHVGGVGAWTARTRAPPFSEHFLLRREEPACSRSRLRETLGEGCSPTKRASGGPPKMSAKTLAGSEATPMPDGPARPEGKAEL